ncbi:hypothetical protein [Zhouia amylolytica]|uniref:hypothetical protein n=1 Tax=Zhouia amylolytica TaxID=376730 RepID=UPI0020CDD88C|nr:hypothetical protein [Zhouia amylolytica]MCQ0113040.1 hypothetical protein [Zhouia amylolytica]
MERTVFKNQNFYILLITFLGILLCWNLWTFWNSKNLIALIPAIIQILILTAGLYINHFSNTTVEVKNIEEFQNQ